MYMSKLDGPSTSICTTVVFNISDSGSILVVSVVVTVVVAEVVLSVLMVVTTKISSRFFFKN